MSDDEFAPFELRGEDAWELAEMLEFIDGWLAAQRTGAVADSLDRHSPGYGLDDLRADLARFMFLLGGPGDRLVYGDGEDQS
jgi:hypothetical protein